MTTLGIEVSTKCKSCGHLVAVNALVPVLACPTCDRRLQMDAARWHLLLEEPLRAGAQMELHTEQSSPFQTEDGVFHRVVRRQDVACTGCGAALPPERLAAMAARGTGFCTGCAAPVAVRAAPEILARHGVAAVLGEDAAQLAGPDAPLAREPVPLACATCGGSLRVDGRQRVVVCHFCQANQYLPDELWKQFHPQKPVVRWFLVWPAAAQAQAAAGGGRRLATWDELADVVIDGYGNLFCAGSNDGYEFAVWSMAPDLTLRWARSGLKFDTTEARLALTPSGHLLLAQPDKRTVLVLGCSDGATAAKLSGKPGEGGALETKELEALASDTDGSILLVASGSRLLRYGAFGEPIATWGAGPREPRPAEDEDGHVVVHMSDRPLFAMSVKMGVGWDGFLYLQAIYSTDDRLRIARFDRRGKRLYLTDVAPGLSTWALCRPCADARGVVHTLVRDDDDVHALWRISPDGRRGERWLVSRKGGGLIGDDDDHLAVAPDGTAWVMGSGGAARRFGPDGRVQMITEASRTRDRQAIEDEDDD